MVKARARPDIVGQRAARLSAGIALVDRPAIIFAAMAVCRLKINLLLCRFPHIADEEIAIRWIHAEAPGVAQPVGPDLGSSGRAVCEWIACRDGVVGAGA